MTFSQGISDVQARCVQPQSWLKPGPCHGCEADTTCSFSLRAVGHPVQLQQGR